MGGVCSCNRIEEQDTIEDNKKKSIQIADSFKEQLMKKISQGDASLLSSYFLMLENSELSKEISSEESNNSKITEHVLCVDLGGTSLKIAVAEIVNKFDISLVTNVVSWQIPNLNVEYTSTHTVYEWIADKIAIFVQDISTGKIKQLPKQKSSNPNKDDDGERNLPEIQKLESIIPEVAVLTFSFPLENKNDKIRLKEYTKNFNWKRAHEDATQDEYPLEELNKCLEKQMDALQYNPIVFKVVINDSIATLLSSRCNDPNTILGVVLGTGTNGAYIEQYNQISPSYRKEKMYVEPKILEAHQDGLMCALNTEWGNFKCGTIDSYRDNIDFVVDDKSLAKSMYLTEKMVGGLYVEQYINEYLANYLVSLDKDCLEGKTDQTIIDSLKGYTLLNKDTNTKPELRIAIEEQVYANSRIASHMYTSLQRTTVDQIIQSLWEIIDRVYNRKYSIIAGMIAGVILRDRETYPDKVRYCIGLNGSGCDKPAFVSQVHARVQEILSSKLMSSENISSPGASHIEIKFRYDDKASLTGAAFAYVTQKYLDRN
ncbi:hexokinase [Nematocida sp. AWRm80]|nr:hexokinase [Nematocida sp. AWRm80]